MDNYNTQKVLNKVLFDSWKLDKDAINQNWKPLSESK